MAKDRFNLFIQLPRPKRIGYGYLSVDKYGEAYFFSSDETVLAAMVRVKLELAAAHGIMLSGFEQNGTHKNGEPKYRYQEWWLAYTDIS